MGHHPTTGEELFPITKELASEWDEQQRKVPPRVPNPVVLGRDTVIFDPVTGAPSLWFSRKRRENTSFLMVRALTPRNGDPLKAFTKDESKPMSKSSKLNQKKLSEEQATLERQKRNETPRMRGRGESMKSNSGETNKRERKNSKRITEQPKRCDELAANPNDPRGQGVGVEFPALKAQAAEAIRLVKLRLSRTVVNYGSNISLGGPWSGLIDGGSTPSSRACCIRLPCGLRQSWVAVLADLHDPEEP